MCGLQYKFCEKILYNSRDIECFLWVYFFGAPCMYNNEYTNI